MSIVSNVVGRLHVGESDRAVIRAVYQAFKARARRDPELRALRKASYREAIAEHSQNRALYISVMSGRCGKGS